MKFIKKNRFNIEFSFLFFFRDLSNNRLGMIGKKTLRGAPLLKNL